MASYSLIIQYVQRDFPRLQALTDGDGKTLIPKDVVMDQAQLTITATYAELAFSYWGHTPEGKQHKRRTAGQARFAPGDGGAGWLAHLWPHDNGGQRAREVRAAIQDLWPEPRPTVKKEVG